jgi:type II secretory pathway component GspD/PulD (secretin)
LELEHGSDKGSMDAATVGMSSGRAARRASALAALVLIAGATAARQDASRPDQPVQPASGDSEAPAVRPATAPNAQPASVPPTPPEALAKEREALEAARRAAEQIQGDPTAAPAGAPRPAPVSAPGVQPGVQPAGAASAQPEALPGPDEISLAAFSEPVELTALIDYVAKSLNINVALKGGLSGTVVFNKGVLVKKDRLLPLLDALLGQQNFTITLDKSGFYTVHPIGDVVVNVTGDAGTTRIISTPNVKPSALKPAIEAQFGGANQSGKAFAYIDELGVIVATDTPRRLEALEDLVSALLTKRTKLTFTPMALEHVAAPVARQRALELVGQVGQSTTRGNNAAEMQMMMQNGGNPAAAASPGTGGQLENLGDRLIVDPVGNGLIFRGTTEEAEQVRAIVAVIDRPASLEPVRYYAGSAAKQIADFARQTGLGEVITITDTSQANRNSPYGEFNFPQAYFQGQGGIGNSGQQIAGGSVMVVDEPRGVIIYYGTASQQREMKRLAEALDTQGDQVVLKIYKLKHNDAEKVAELINGLINNQTPAGESTLTSGTGTGFAGASNTRRNMQTSRPENAEPLFGNAAPNAGSDGLAIPEGEAFAIADKANNQVLIKAPGKQQEQFARLIEGIDLRRPQVYIECKIVAVNASDTFRLAFETQLLQAGGDAVINTNFGLSSFPSGASLDQRKNVATGLSGLTAAIIKSSNVPLIITALQNQSDTQILSTPTLLVDDNEEAKIASVDQQPTTTSNQSTSTTSTSFNGYESAGTELSVKPQISEGGYLRLKYEAKLSSFTGTGANGIPPPKQENTVNSDSVTVPSDMTVVVGGLTLDSRRKTVIKVPLLGDIPIIGQLFKDDNKDDRKTTLYIFLTPRILRDQNFADLRLLTKGPQQRSKVADDIPMLSPTIMPTVPPESRPLLPPISDQPEQKDAVAPTRPEEDGTNQHGTDQ